MSPFAKRMLAAGRNAGPELLYRAWRSGEIDTERLREWILPTWEGAEFPASLGQRLWLEMFAATGFVHDDITGEGFKPPSPLVVYRGAALSRARGFSWTWDLYRAQWFAARTALLDLPAGVFTVTLERDMLLAVNAGVEGRSEHEVLVNPNRLRGRWTPRLLERVDEDAD